VLSVKNDKNHTFKKFNELAIIIASHAQQWTVASGNFDVGLVAQYKLNSSHTMRNLPTSLDQLNTLIFTTYGCRHFGLHRTAKVVIVV